MLNFHIIIRTSELIDIDRSVAATLTVSTEARINIIERGRGASAGVDEERTSWPKSTRFARVIELQIKRAQIIPDHGYRRHPAQKVDGPPRQAGFLRLAQPQFCDSESDIYVIRN